MRKGMAKGRGKGYKNIMGNDSKIHSQSAKGIRQPQRINPIHQLKMKVLRSMNLEDLKFTKKLAERDLKRFKDMPKQVKNFKETISETDKLIKAKIDNKKKYPIASDELIIEELKNIEGFIKIYTDDEGHITTVSLKDDISFKQFSNFYPEVTRKDLLLLFDEVEKRSIMSKVLYD